MLSRILKITICLGTFACVPLIEATLTTLAKNDPFPVFTTQDPHTFLLLKKKLEYKDIDFAACMGETFCFSISPFAQNANHGLNYQGGRTEGFCLQGPGGLTDPCGVNPDVCLADLCNTDTTCGAGRLKDRCTELGNLEGLWNMPALLFGPTPQGHTLAPTLQIAQEALYPNQPLPLEDNSLIDPAQRCGFFSVPLSYRKRGLRFDMAAQICGGLGFDLQTGVADITQTLIRFVDLTPTSTLILDNPCFSCDRCNVEDFLMDELDDIADEICLDLCDFHELSIEEVRFNLYWRTLFDLNRDCREWPRFLLVPFAMFSGSVSPGKVNTNRKPFAVPFGNNGHNALGFSGGLNFDFVDTIEIGGEIGFTHFFEKDFSCFFVPNFEEQRGIFPFMTNVSIQPGHNWHFAGKISAYHFLEHLSLYFQYVMIDHGQDKIETCPCDDAFLPEVLECLSNWRVKLGNVGANYDLTPNCGLGFFWQMPFSQRNAYKSTTVMFSFYATF